MKELDVLIFRMELTAQKIRDDLPEAERWGRDAYYKHELRLYERFIDHLRKLREKLAKEERRGGWIPCAERLPEYGQRVLCVDKDGDMVIARRMRSGTSLFFGGEYWHEYDQSCPVHLTDVDKWQPLPEREEDNA